MHFHFVLDEPQYNTLFEHLIDEARSRRHTVTTGRRFVCRYDADAYIGLQDAALKAAPRPRVFLTHGLGLAKRGALRLDVDLLLLPYGGEGIIDDHGSGATAAGKAPMVVRNLGSPKIDLLQRRARQKAAIQRRLRELYDFDSRPIVGYCPTFRHRGTLHHPQRGHRLREVEALLEGRYNVVALPHSLECDPEEVAELRFRPSPALPRVDHFVGLDCAVTDTSGIGFELCAIDMPMVLLDNPAEPDYLLARMLERPVRIDYGPVCTLATLADAVAASLANPAAHAARRAHWAEMAFGPRDGGAAARSIDAIERFVTERRGHYAGRRGQGQVLEDYLRRRMASFHPQRDWRLDKGTVTMAFDGTERWCFYGPYQPLGTGRFALEVDLDATVPGPFHLQIDADGGRRTLAKLGFEQALRASIPFEVPAELAGRNLEFRLTQPKEASGELTLRCLRLHLIGLPSAAAGLEVRPATAAVSTVLDPAWQQIADHLRRHAAAADHVQAPAPFHPWLTHCRRVEEQPVEGHPADWVVLHKGSPAARDVADLSALSARAEPVLANPVFILWRARPGFAAGDTEGPLHARPVLQRLGGPHGPVPAFPRHDTAWNEVAEILARHGLPGVPVLAPGPFRQVLTQPVDEQAAEGTTYGWVVLHKGRLAAMPTDFLRTLPRDYRPVLANAVFILWHRKSGVEMSEAAAPHLAPFHAHLLRLEEGMAVAS
ncbi:CDP-glycerol glycerophosphotransferase family protein [Teichococcus aerofrigidensis]